MDSREKACVRFRFYVGQNDLLAKSDATERICFESQFIIELSSDDHSKSIARNFDFERPTKIKVIFYK